MWSLTDSVLVRLTPKIFSDETRLIPTNGGGGATRHWCLPLVKTISTVMARFSLRSFNRDEVSLCMLSSSVCLE
jgi:hypothetical protein